MNIQLNLRSFLGFSLNSLLVLKGRRRGSTKPFFFKMINTHGFYNVLQIACWYWPDLAIVQENRLGLLELKTGSWISKKFELVKHLKLMELN